MLTACDKKETPQERIERLCDITLPADMEIEYNFVDETFTGLASQYTVFLLDDEPAEFISEQVFENSKVDFIDRLTLHKVPQEYYSEWDSEYESKVIAFGWQDSGTFLYFTASQKLIVYIQGH